MMHYTLSICIHTWWVNDDYCNIYIYIYILFLLWCCDPARVMASILLRFVDHTQGRTTVGRTPLDKWTACRRDFYLKTHNNHNRQTSMSPVVFEPIISAGERPQTYALDCVASGTGNICCIPNSKCRKLNWNVQCDVGHYTNILRYLLVASKIQTGVC
jgi:hypothetical protein